MAKIIFKFDIHKLCEENFCRATIILIIYVKKRTSKSIIKVSWKYHYIWLYDNKATVVRLKGV